MKLIMQCFMMIMFTTILSTIVKFYFAILFLNFKKIVHRDWKNREEFTWDLSEKWNIRPETSYIIVLRWLCFIRSYIRTQIFNYWSFDFVLLVFKFIETIKMHNNIFTIYQKNDILSEINYPMFYDDYVVS